MNIPLSRRDLLRAGAGAGGAVLLARPASVLADELPSIDAYGTPRASRLFPGEFVVHSDMHNHSLFSDGDGDPVAYYDLMRASGVDVAALTDHATFSEGLPDSPCPAFGPVGAERDCQSLAGLNDRTWTETKAMADEKDAPGDFAAIAGFEWSSPTLGHMNVWFSEHFSDPAHTGGLGSVDDLAEFARQEGFPLTTDQIDQFRALVRDTPAAGAGMRGWFEWLKRDPSTPAVSGGGDAIFGFNHPGREPFRFNDFVLDEDLVDRCVSMELFNKSEDYLFEQVDVGRASPLVACLDAGWRPGILGTSDYHGTDWGTPDDKGRAGMYVTDLSRAGVREAMEARRFFATRIKGVRFDATANGARMGSSLRHSSGDVTFRVDIDRGQDWYGKRLSIQVLGTGSTLPTLLDVVDVTVPTPQQPVLEFTVDIDATDHRWVVLRVSDPDGPAEGNAPDDTWRGFGMGLVYGSPFYLDPEGTVVTARTDAVTAAQDAPESRGGGSGLAGVGALALAGLVGLRRRQTHDHAHEHGTPHTH